MTPGPCRNATEVKDYHHIEPALDSGATPGSPPRLRSRTNRTLREIDSAPSMVYPAEHWQFRVLVLVAEGGAT
jgi:hypothetical protein